MDHSPKKKMQTPGTASRPHSGGVQPEASPSGKMMEGSFALLPSAPVSVDGSESQAGGDGYAQSVGDSPSSQLSQNTSGFHSTVTVLKRAFDIAAAQTQVRLTNLLVVNAWCRNVGLVQGLLEAGNSF